MEFETSHDSWKKRNIFASKEHKLDRLSLAKKHMLALQARLPYACPSVPTEQTTCTHLALINVIVGVHRLLAAKFTS